MTNDDGVEAMTNDVWAERAEKVNKIAAKWAERAEEVKRMRQGLEAVKLAIIILRRTFETGDINARRDILVDALRALEEGIDRTLG